MKKKICKNCKFWERGTNTPFGERYDPYGDCKNEKIACNFPSKEDEKTPNFLFALPNSENYGISFYIGEDFGCIHWNK